MNPRQREIFYKRTGFQEPESYIDCLREAGHSHFSITDADYPLWESGFAGFAMINYEWEPTSKGIIVEL